MWIFVTYICFDSPRTAISKIRKSAFTALHPKIPHEYEQARQIVPFLQPHAVATMLPQNFSSDPCQITENAESQLHQPHEETRCCKVIIVLSGRNSTSLSASSRMLTANANAESKPTTCSGQISDQMGFEHPHALYSCQDKRCVIHE